ncbi:MAG TPA: anti-sigma factor [Candidatus Polarisedimenticolia bacterium]|nr:anti-sigma factor [Candidatus Polarisedimenticolia bacterium]
MAPERSEADYHRATIARLGWALAAFFVFLWAILLFQSSRLRGEASKARDQVASLSRDLASERRWSVILSSPSMRTANFTRTPDADLALRARAVLDPASRRAVLVFENFVTPPGQAYEVWALHGNQAMPVGRVAADRSGRAVMRVENVGNTEDLSAFTISLESLTAPANASGTPREPTGPIVMIGSLGG